MFQLGGGGQEKITRKICILSTDLNTGENSYPVYFNLKGLVFSTFEYIKYIFLYIIVNNYETFYNY